MKSYTKLLPFACLILLVCSGFAMGQSQLDTDAIVDWPVRMDPNLTPPNPVQVLPQSLHKVWLAALDQSELQVRMQTMQAIASAQRMGITGLSEIYSAKLKQVLNNTNSELPAKMSAAQALIVMDDKTSASELFAHNQTQQIDWVLLTDAPLAQWRYLTAIDMWIKRATDPQTSWTIRHSAMQQLATLHPEKAHGPLRQLLSETTLDPLLKFEAAKALGQIASQGLLADAQRLAKGDLINRLSAVACLASHDSDQVKTLLLALLKDREPTVVLAAGQLLLKIAPAQLANEIKPLQTSDDSSLRNLAADCLIDQITPQRVAMLAPMLSDNDPQIRQKVRGAYIQLAEKSELKEPITQAAMGVIKVDDWRGQQQAAYVLGKLDVKNAVSSLFDVLEQSKRTETRIAAATAIRWLNVADAQDKALNLATELFEGMKKNPASERGMELAQLFQWFGDAKYMPSIPLLLELIPKNIAPSIAREAAVWSIGKIGPTPKTKNLTNKLMARIKDMNEMNPESTDVQLAAMVTLVRLGSSQVVIQYLESQAQAAVMMDTQVLESCKIWATSQAEGKPFVMPIPEPAVASGWFLQPLKMTAD